MGRKPISSRRTNAGLARLVSVLMRLAWRHRRHLLPALVAAVVLSGLTLAPPALLAHLIDKVLPSQNPAFVLAVGAAGGGAAARAPGCAGDRDGGRRGATQRGHGWHRFDVDAAFARWPQPCRALLTDDWRRSIVCSPALPCAHVRVHIDDRPPRQGHAAEAASAGPRLNLSHT